MSNDGEPITTNRLKLRQLIMAGILTGFVGVLFALATKPNIPTAITIVAGTFFAGTLIELVLAAREIF